MTNSSKFRKRLLIPLLTVLLLVNFVLLVVVGMPLLRPGGWSLLNFAATQSPAQTAAAEPGAAPQSALTNLDLPPYLPPPKTYTAEEGLKQDGLIILSLRDGNHANLFAYHPLYLPLTRITDDPWDNLAPAVSPDAARVAFSSRRNGYWNLYVLDLLSGRLEQITDTPEYIGEPTWSPDGQWLAYEGYAGGNLDIFVASIIDPSQPPIRLTEGKGSNSSPAWSPLGREIAFISTRSGEPEVWLAHLDEVDERYRNLSRNRDQSESYPAWSPDGRYLAWASESGGVSELMVWNRQKPDSPPHHIAHGSRPVWNPQGNLLLAEIRSPNHTGLTVYALADRQLLYPLARLPGSLLGADWRAGRFVELYPTLPRPRNAEELRPPLSNPALSANPMPPSGRFGIVPLDDVTAPHPFLHDAVDEAFYSLRRQVSRELGWDLLSSLESAYFPLTDPPPPGMEANWLMTGRAIALNPAPLHAGWIAMVREDFSGLTYWRVFAKTRFQDGSQGIPLQTQPWDISARYEGSPQAYERGGQLAPVAEGYWVDVTDIALRYGWERLPAMSNWRTYFPGTRFNQFVYSAGLDWYAAMAEIYPPEALATSTPIPTHTTTVTLTPIATQRHTQTPTPTITLTATLNPTLTPQP